MSEDNEGIVIKRYKIKYDKSKNKRKFIHFTLDKYVPELFFEIVPLEIKGKDQYGIDTYKPAFRDKERELIRIRNRDIELKDEINALGKDIESNRKELKKSIKKDDELLTDLNITFENLVKSTEDLSKKERTENFIRQVKNQVDTHDTWLLNVSLVIEELRSRKSEIIDKINESDISKEVKEPYTLLLKELDDIESELKNYQEEINKRETELGEILDKVDEIEKDQKVTTWDWFKAFVFSLRPDDHYIKIGDFYDEDVSGKYYFMANLTSPFVREMSGTYLFYEKITSRPENVYESDFSNFKLVAEITIEITNVVQELLLPADVRYVMDIPPTQKLDNLQYFHRVGIRRIATKTSRKTSLNALKRNIKTYEDSFLDLETKGLRPLVFEYFDTRDRNIAVSKTFFNYISKWGKEFESWSDVYYFLESMTRIYPIDIGDPQQLYMDIFMEYSDRYPPKRSNNYNEDNVFDLEQLKYKKEIEFITSINGTLNLPRITIPNTSIADSGVYFVQRRLSDEDKWEFHIIFDVIVVNQIETLIEGMDHQQSMVLSSVDAINSEYAFPQWMKIPYNPSSIDKLSPIDIISEMNRDLIQREHSLTPSTSITDKDRLPLVLYDSEFVIKSLTPVNTGIYYSYMLGETLRYDPNFSARDSKISTSIEELIDVELIQNDGSNKLIDFTKYTDDMLTFSIKTRFKEYPESPYDMKAWNMEVLVPREGLSTKVITNAYGDKYIVYYSFPDQDMLAAMQQSEIELVYDTSEFAQRFQITKGLFNIHFELEGVNYDWFNEKYVNLNKQRLIKVSNKWGSDDFNVLLEIKLGPNEFEYVHVSTTLEDTMADAKFKNDVDNLITTANLVINNFMEGDDRRITRFVEEYKAVPSLNIANNVRKNVVEEMVSKISEQLLNPQKDNLINVIGINLTNNLNENLENFQQDEIALYQLYKSFYELIRRSNDPRLDGENTKWLIEINVAVDDFFNNLSTGQSNFADQLDLDLIIDSDKLITKMKEFTKFSRDGVKSIKSMLRNNLENFKNLNRLLLDIFDEQYRPILSTADNYFESIRSVINYAMSKELDTISIGNDFIGEYLDRISAYELELGLYHRDGGIKSYYDNLEVGMLDRLIQSSDSWINTIQSSSNQVSESILEAIFETLKESDTLLLEQKPVLEGLVNKAKNLISGILNRYNNAEKLFSDVISTFNTLNNASSSVLNSIDDKLTDIQERFDSIQSKDFVIGEDTNTPYITHDDAQTYKERLVLVIDILSGDSKSVEGIFEVDQDDIVTAYEELINNIEKATVDAEMTLNTYQEMLKERFEIITSIIDWYTNRFDLNDSGSVANTIYTAVKDIYLWGNQPSLISEDIEEQLKNLILELENNKAVLSDDKALLESYKNNLDVGGALSELKSVKSNIDSNVTLFDDSIKDVDDKDLFNKLSGSSDLKDVVHLVQIIINRVKDFDIQLYGDYVNKYTEMVSQSDTLSQSIQNLVNLFENFKINLNAEIEDKQSKIERVEEQIRALSDNQKTTREKIKALLSERARSIYEGMETLIDNYNDTAIKLQKDNQIMSIDFRDIIDYIKEKGPGKGIIGNIITKEPNFDRYDVSKSFVVGNVTYNLATLYKEMNDLLNNLDIIKYTEEELENVAKKSSSDINVALTAYKSYRNPSNDYIIAVTSIINEMKNKIRNIDRASLDNINEFYDVVSEIKSFSNEHNEIYTTVYDEYKETIFNNNDTLAKYLGQISNAYLIGDVLTNNIDSVLEHDSTDKEQIKQLVDKYYNVVVVALGGDDPQETKLYKILTELKQVLAELYSRRVSNELNEQGKVINESINLIFSELATIRSTLDKISKEDFPPIDVTYYFDFINQTTTFSVAYANLLYIYNDVYNALNIPILKDAVEDFKRTKPTSLEPQNSKEYNNYVRAYKNFVSDKQVFIDKIKALEDAVVDFQETLSSYKTEETRAIIEKNKQIVSDQTKVFEQSFIEAEDMIKTFVNVGDVESLQEQSFTINARLSELKSVVIMIANSIKAVKEQYLNKNLDDNNYVSEEFAKANKMQEMYNKLTRDFKSINDSMIRSLITQTSDNERTISDLKDKITRLSKRNNNLSSQLNESEKRVNTETKANRELLVDKAKLQNELERVKNSLSQSENQIESLVNEKLKYQEELDRVISRLEGSNKINNDKTEEIQLLQNDLKKTLSELSKAIESKEKDSELVINLENQQKVQQKRLTKLQREKEAVVALIDEYSNKIKGYRSKLKETESQLQNEQTKTNDLGKELEKLNKQLESVKSKAEVLSTSLRNSELENSRLKELLKENEDALNQSKNRLTSLQEDIEEKEKELSSLKNSLKSTRDELQSKEEQLKVQKQQIDTINLQNKKLKEIIDKERGDVDIARNEYEKVKTTLNEVSKELANVNDNLKNKESTETVLMTNIQKNRQKLKSIRSKARSLQDTLDVTSKQRDEALVDLHAVRQSLKIERSLRSQAESIRDDLKLSLTEAQNEVVTLNNQLSSIKEELEKQKKFVSRSQATVLSLNQTKELLSNEIEAKEREIENVNERLRSNQLTSVQANRLVDDLTKDINDKTEELKEKESLIADLNNKIVQQIEENAKNVEKIRKLTLELAEKAKLEDSIEKSYLKAEKDLKKLEIKFKETNKKLSESEDRIRELENSISNLEREKALSAKELDDTKKTLQLTNVELLNVKSDLAIIKSEKDRVESEKQRVEEELLDAKKTIDRQKNEAQARILELNTFNAKIDDMELDLASTNKDLEKARKKRDELLIKTEEFKQRLKESERIRQEKTREFIETQRRLTEAEEAIEKAKEIEKKSEEERKEAENELNEKLQESQKKAKELEQKVVESEKVLKVKVEESKRLDRQLEAVKKADEATGLLNYVITYRNILSERYLVKSPNNVYIDILEQDYWPKDQSLIGLEEEEEEENEFFELEPESAIILDLRNELQSKETQLDELQIEKEKVSKAKETIVLLLDKLNDPVLMDNIDSPKLYDPNQYNKNDSNEEQLKNYIAKSKVLITSIKDDVEQKKYGDLKDMYNDKIAEIDGMRDDLTSLIVKFDQALNNITNTINSLSTNVSSLNDKIKVLEDESENSKDKIKNALNDDMKPIFDDIDQLNDKYKQYLFKINNDFSEKVSDYEKLKKVISQKGIKGNFPEIDLSKYNPSGIINVNDVQLSLSHVKDDIDDYLAADILVKSVEDAKDDKIRFENTILNNKVTYSDLWDNGKAIKDNLKATAGIMKNSAMDMIKDKSDDKQQLDSLIKKLGVLKTENKELFNNSFEQLNDQYFNGVDTFEDYLKYLNDFYDLGENYGRNVNILSSYNPGFELEDMNRFKTFIDAYDNIIKGSFENGILEGAIEALSKLLETYKRSAEEMKEKEREEEERKKALDEVLEALDDQQDKEKRELEEKRLLEEQKKLEEKQKKQKKLEEERKERRKLTSDSLLTINNAKNDLNTLLSSFQDLMEEVKSTDFNDVAELKPYEEKLDEFDESVKEKYKVIEDNIKILQDANYRDLDIIEIPINNVKAEISTVKADLINKFDEIETQITGKKREMENEQKVEKLTSDRQELDTLLLEMDNIVKNIDSLKLTEEADLEASKLEYSEKRKEYKLSLQNFEDDVKVAKGAYPELLEPYVSEGPTTMEYQLTVSDELYDTVIDFKLDQLKSNLKTREEIEKLVADLGDKILSMENLNKKLQVTKEKVVDLTDEIKTLRAKNPYDPVIQYTEELITNRYHPLINNNLLGLYTEIDGGDLITTRLDNLGTFLSQNQYGEHDQVSKMIKDVKKRYENVISAYGNTIKGVPGSYHEEYIVNINKRSFDLLDKAQKLARQQKRIDDINDAALNKFKEASSNANEGLLQVKLFANKVDMYKDFLDNESVLIKRVDDIMNDVEKNLAVMKDTVTILETNGYKDAAIHRNQYNRRLKSFGKTYDDARDAISKLFELRPLIPLYPKKDLSPKVWKFTEPEYEPADKSRQLADSDKQLILTDSNFDFLQVKPKIMTNLLLFLVDVPLVNVDATEGETIELDATELIGDESTYMSNNKIDIFWDTPRVKDAVNEKFNRGSGTLLVTVNSKDKDDGLYTCIAVEFMDETYDTIIEDGEDPRILTEINYKILFRVYFNVNVKRKVNLKERRKDIGHIINNIHQYPRVLLKAKELYNKDRNYNMKRDELELVLYKTINHTTEYNNVIAISKEDELERLQVPDYRLAPNLPKTTAGIKEVVINNIVISELQGSNRLIFKRTLNRLISKMSSLNVSEPINFNHTNPNKLKTEFYKLFDNYIDLEDIIDLIVRDQFEYNKSKGIYPDTRLIDVDFHSYLINNSSVLEVINRKEIESVPLRYLLLILKRSGSEYVVSLGDAVHFFNIKGLKSFVEPFNQFLKVNKLPSIPKHVNYILKKDFVTFLKNGNAWQSPLSLISNNINERRIHDSDIKGVLVNIDGEYFIDIYSAEDILIEHGLNQLLRKLREYYRVKLNLIKSNDTKYIPLDSVNEFLSDNNIKFTILQKIQFDRYLKRSEIGPNTNDGLVASIMENNLNLWAKLVNSLDYVPGDDNSYHVIHDGERRFNLEKYLDNVTLRDLNRQINNIKHYNGLSNEEKDILNNFFVVKEYGPPDEQPLLDMEYSLIMPGFIKGGMVPVEKEEISFENRYEQFRDKLFDTLSKINGDLTNKVFNKLYNDEFGSINFDIDINYQHKDESLVLSYVKGISPYNEMVKVLKLATLLIYQRERKIPNVQAIAADLIQERINDEDDDFHKYLQRRIDRILSEIYKKSTTYKPISNLYIILAFSIAKNLNLFDISIFERFIEEEYKILDRFISSVNKDISGVKYQEIYSEIGPKVKQIMNNQKLMSLIERLDNDQRNFLKRITKIHDKLEMIVYKGGEPSVYHVEFMTRAIKSNGLDGYGTRFSINVPKSRQYSEFLISELGDLVTPLKTWYNHLLSIVDSAIFKGPLEISTAGLDRLSILLGDEGALVSKGILAGADVDNDEYLGYIDDVKTSIETYLELPYSIDDDSKGKIYLSKEYKLNEDGTDIYDKLETLVKAIDDYEEDELKNVFESDDYKKIKGLDVSLFYNKIPDVDKSIVMSLFPKNVSIYPYYYDHLEKSMEQLKDVELWNSYRDMIVKRSKEIWETIFNRSSIKTINSIVRELDSMIKDWADYSTLKDKYYLFDELSDEKLPNDMEKYLSGYLERSGTSEFDLPFEQRLRLRTIYIMYNQLRNPKVILRSIDTIENDILANMDTDRLFDATSLQERKKILRDLYQKSYSSGIGYKSLFDYLDDSLFSIRINTKVFNDINVKLNNPLGKPIEYKRYKDYYEKLYNAFKRNFKIYSEFHDIYDQELRENSDISDTIFYRGYKLGREPKIYDDIQLMDSILNDKTSFEELQLVVDYNDSLRNIFNQHLPFVYNFDEDKKRFQQFIANDNYYEGPGSGVKVRAELLKLRKNRGIMKFEDHENYFKTPVGFNIMKNLIKLYLSAELDNINMADLEELVVKKTIDFVDDHDDVEDENASSTVVLSVKNGLIDKEKALEAINDDKVLQEDAGEVLLHYAKNKQLTVDELYTYSEKVSKKGIEDLTDFFISAGKLNKLSRSYYIDGVKPINNKVSAIISMIKKGLYNIEEIIRLLELYKNEIKESNLEDIMTQVVKQDVLKDNEQFKKNVDKLLTNAGKNQSKYILIPIIKHGSYDYKDYEESIAIGFVNIGEFSVPESSFLNYLVSEGLLANGDERDIATAVFSS